MRWPASRACGRPRATDWVPLRALRPRSALADAGLLARHRGARVRDHDPRHRAHHRAPRAHPGARRHRHANAHPERGLTAAGSRPRVPGAPGRAPLREPDAARRGGSIREDRGLLLVEDCAQSFTGLEYRGHEAADVSMFSFGPLKTSSALGGALLRVKDAALLGRMKSLHATYPIQGRGRYLKRVLRFGAVRLVMQPLPYTTLCAACRALGRNHDELLNQAIRGFSGPAFFRNIRHQPSRALLALLWRRLTAPTSRVPRRIERHRRSSASCQRSRGRAGRRPPLLLDLPDLSDAPDALVSHLAERGFDSTRGA